MIRTYNTDGTLDKAYKLYSGKRPQISGETELASELAADAALGDSNDFASKPALYTDLNSPAIFQSTVAYPIADPRALGKVDGFNYRNSVTAPTQTFNVNGTSQNLPVIPMPVQWMYMLRDGQAVAPDMTGNGRQISVPGASAGNPVVGRIAYWTDDETCKLNLNTAADGSYWDTPRTGSIYDSNPATGQRDADRKYAQYQPAQREYQRYGGHPATTSLRPVFEKYLSGAGTPLDAWIRETLVSLSPRYTPCADAPIKTGSMGGTRMPSVPLESTTKPFYTAPDEYYFDKNRVARNSTLQSPDSFEQTRFFVTSSSRAPEVNLFNMPRVSMWPVSAMNDQDHRTPYDQVNLFCASLGPEGTNNIYAFTRSNPNAENGELNTGSRNAAIYDYLDTLMSRPVPGFGGSFRSKYGTDQSQILTEIYDFIRCTNICDQSANRSSFVPFTTKPTITPQKTLQETPGTGQVRPTVHGSTKGFGRFPIITEAALTIVGEKTVVAGVQYYQARPILLLEFSCLTHGPHGIGANLLLNVSGLDQFRVDPNTSDTDNSTISLFPSSLPDVRGYGRGTMSITTTTNAGEFPSWGATMGLSALTVYDKRDRYTSSTPGTVMSPVDRGYPYIGNIFTYTAPFTSATSSPVSDFNTFFDPSAKQFACTGGTIEVTLSLPAPNNANPVHKYRMTFPAFTSRYPIPWVKESRLMLNDGNHLPYEAGTAYPPGRVDMSTLAYRLSTRGVIDGTYPADKSWSPERRLPVALDVTKSVVPMGDSTIGRIDCDHRLHSVMTGLSDSQLERIFQPYRNPTTGAGYFSPEVGRYDSTKSPTPWLYTPSHCLSRVHGACANPGNLFLVNAAIHPVTGSATGGRNLDVDGGFGNYVKGLVCGAKTDGACQNDLPSWIDGVQNYLGKPGDFDTGVSWMADGPWINKADEGDAPVDPVAHPGVQPYFGFYRGNIIGEANFSPNRQVPSPVQFGSLPTGVKAAKPWQTLLFCPNPSALTNYTGTPLSLWHPGFITPPDHLLLDLFWMPVVEPYAISDPSSTAGKVNLNCNLAPFSQITRDTALRGVLRNVKIQAIPNAHSADYKGRIWNKTDSNYRYPLEINKTIEAIKAKTPNGELFLSPSQICEVFLIPRKEDDPNIAATNPVSTTGLNFSNVLSSFWDQNKLTGDNARERPYNVIYPRLTTKSNVYTVHYTVQALKKVPGSTTSGWDEDRDKVLGEQRGATTIERYIDPRDPEFRISDYDFASRVNDSNPPTLGRFYKFRTVATRQFRQ